MGLRGNPSTGGFGRYVSFREVTIDTSTNKMEPKPTRTIMISEQLYRRFIAHSKKYYKNPESYEIILNNLLDEYDKHNNNSLNYIHFERN